MEKSFHGSTEAGAKQHAADWIKSQRGIAVRNERAIWVGNNTGQKGEKIKSGDSWILIVEYEVMQN